MAYTPRRLRPGSTPRWLITVPPHLSREQAEAIQKQWDKAQHHRAIVLPESMKVYPMSGRAVIRPGGAR